MLIDRCTDRAFLSLQVEETVVRDKAVESINIVGAELPEASVTQFLVPLVQVHRRSGCTLVLWDADMVF